MHTLRRSKLGSSALHRPLAADPAPDPRRPTTLYRASPYARAFTTVQCVTSQHAISPGDALRQLDAMQVLNPKSPFLLLQSPIVSSLDLGTVVRRHKQRREADKSLIMTLAVGTGGRCVRGGRGRGLRGPLKSSDAI